jgi:hypothetical protein
MPLQKILFKPGVNRENTRYTNEGGWYECDKIRFRQGTPEVIGGWDQISTYTYLGVCRSLWSWANLAGVVYTGVGTNLKFYIEAGGAYNDITPIRTTIALGANPFAATGTTTVTVTCTAHGAGVGDFVTFNGATGTYSTILNAEYQVVSVVNANSFTITTSSALAAGSYGGSAVVASFQVGVGSETVQALNGWGANVWGFGPWADSSTSFSFRIRIWNQINYGQDLVFGPRGGGIYYWSASATTPLSTRGVLMNSLGGTVTITIASPAVVTATVVLTEGAAVSFSTTGALPTGITAGTTYYAFQVDGLTFNLLTAAGAVVNTTGTQSGTQSITLKDVPTVQNVLTVSDTSRFVFAMGCNDYATTTLDPMLIRWSNQDDIYNWTPDATNQAGSIRLSHGSEIVTSVQTRQELIVFTDSSVYSLQYLGPPYVWSSQLLGDNISITGPNAAVLASGVVFWMGVDKFYMYDGRVQTLNCDLRRYVFGDIDQSQFEQVFAGTNEGFNEVWWFYCSNGSYVVDKYVVYNYMEKVWYYGTMGRTAWLDSGINNYPLAATYSNNLVTHESGINDNETITTAAIDAYISSSEFDIGDGHNFGFVWRVLPDLTFEGSSNSPTGTTATVTMQLYGLTNSGSGATTGVNQPVSSSNTYNITEEFTGQVYTRLRGRQMIFKISSDQINTAWQLGAPRIDIRPDGRR